MSKNKQSGGEIVPQLQNNVPAVQKSRPADRELAKLGMTISMGALVATGFSRTRSSRKLHLLAGGALIGFSVWHHLLYNQPKSNRSVTESQNG